MDGEGGAPLSVKKKSIKNWPKNAVFGEKIRFSEMDRPWRGGGEPPFPVNFFPLTFRKNLVRGGPGGFLNPSLGEWVPVET